MTFPSTEVVVEGLRFPEDPRWRDDGLWFSDVYGGAVHHVGRDGRDEVVVSFDGRPSGLGWIDGDLVVVSIDELRLLRLVDGELRLHADLSGIATEDLNDMCIGPSGRAYVGSSGAPTPSEPPFPADGALYVVEPDGKARLAADKIAIPNGCALTPDGRTLYLAETGGCRILAFDVAEDGGLHGRRTLVDLGFPVYTDGICLDAEGSVWVGIPLTREAIRISSSGEVQQRIDFGRPVFAVALGGDEGRSLFICTVDTLAAAAKPEQGAGRIEAYKVAVPGIQCP